MEYTVKTKIKRSKEDYNKIKSKVKSIAEKEINPEISEAIRDVILFKKMSPGAAPIDFATFMVANAGLISAAIIENMSKKYVNMGSARTRVRAEETNSGTDLIISAEISEAAAKLFKEKGTSPEAIMNLVTNISPSAVNKIMGKLTEK